MEIALLVILGMIALVALFSIARRMVRTYLEYRGKGVVVCPETRKPVAIEVNAAHAALTIIPGLPELRLKDCSRWPERAACGQECVAQIERAPEHCMVRTVLGDWFQGRACVYCGKLFGEINWTDHKPALLNLAHETVGWEEIPPEELYESLTTHLPVCWNCHVAETFRREHPDLVVDRPSRTGIHA